MKKLQKIDISKETFDWPIKNNIPLDHLKWKKFIDKRLDYFTWYEDTDEGKKLKNNLQKYPIEFRDKLSNKLNNTQVNAEFNVKKGYYEVILMFNKEFSIISSTFQKKIKPHHLRMLLDMANYLDAYLLNNGTEIIDESYITKLT